MGFIAVVLSHYKLIANPSPPRAPKTSAPSLEGPRKPLVNLRSVHVGTAKGEEVWDVVEVACFGRLQSFIPSLLSYSAPGRWFC